MAWLLHGASLLQDCGALASFLVSTGARIVRCAVASGDRVSPLGETLLRSKVWPEAEVPWPTLSVNRWRRCRTKIGPFEEKRASLLGRLNDTRAVLPLTKLLRGADRAVREAAVGALSALGQVSVPALAGCLNDPALQVQEAASAILAVLADARVLTPLTQALGSRDWIVRMHAGARGSTRWRP